VIARRPFSPLRALPVVALLALAGCDGTGFFAYPMQARGAQVDAEQLKQLVPGTSTRQDVSALLGTPTAKATFDDNTWLYISQETKPVIAGTQGIRSQNVYVLSFDERGVLTGVTTRTRDDGLSVAVVSNTTPSPGSEASIMQELLGNIGRFSAGSSQQNTSPGAGNNPGPSGSGSY
jgi:outer membrane protein assembly factor BamE (lipoprotein component of BamABCDE complex)